MTKLTIAEIQALVDRQSSKYNGLMNRGKYADAIKFADKLKGPPGYPTVYDQLRAAVFTDAGLAARDRPSIQRGVSMWSEMIAKAPTPALRTNRANARVNILWSSIRAQGWSGGWSDDRRLLHEARAEYLDVAEDESLEPSQRLRALVNVGNSYDDFARHVEAIELYDRALALDPGFGMANGNKGMALARLAPYVRGHQAAVLQDAGAHLTAATNNRASVVAAGGEDALKRFQKWLEWVREKLGDRRGAAADADPIADTYGRWCLRHDLMLHPSPTCLTSKTAEGIHCSSGRSRRALRMASRFHHSLRRSTS